MNPSLLEGFRRPVPSNHIQVVLNSDKENRIMANEVFQFYPIHVLVLG